MTLATRRIWTRGDGREETHYVSLANGETGVVTLRARGVTAVDLTYRRDDSLGGFDLATWERELAWRAHFGPLVDLPAEAVCGESA